MLLDWFSHKHPTYLHRLVTEPYYIDV